jgi:GT2 family glycosyltransferase
MNIATVILNYNGLTLLPECLESLRHLKDTTHPIIVDNASTDNSPELINSKFSEATLIRNTANLGFAAGNNVGIRFALQKNFDAVMFLNSDTKVHPDLVTQLIKADTDLASPKIYFYPGFEFHHDRYQDKDRGRVLWYAGGSIDWNNVWGMHRGVDEVDHGQFDTPTDLEFATGCCLLIKRAVFDRIGLFDPRYFLYYEDLDFCIRARKAQFAIRYLPSALLWHKNAQSSASGGSLHQYYFTRNRLLFGWHYALWRTKAALMRQSVKQFFTGTPAEKQGVKDFYLRRFGAKS